jgi:hypothetical protein
MSMMQQQKQFVLNLERAVASLAKSMDDTLAEMKEDSQTAYENFNDFIMLVIHRASKDEILVSWNEIESILPETYNACSLVDDDELTIAVADLRYAVFDDELDYEYLRELYFDLRQIIDKMSKKTITTIRKTINDHIKINTKLMDRGTSVSEGLRAQMNDMREAEGLND